MDQKEGVSCMKLARRWDPEAAARSLQAACLAPRVPTAEPEPLRQEAGCHCGIAHMKLPRAEAAAGENRPTKAGSRANTNGAIKREPVPPGVTRSGM